MAVAAAARRQSLDEMGAGSDMVPVPVPVSASIVMCIAGNINDESCWFRVAAAGVGIGLQRFQAPG